MQSFASILGLTVSGLLWYLLNLPNLVAASVIEVPDWIKNTYSYTNQAVAVGGSILMAIAVEKEFFFILL